MSNEVDRKVVELSFDNSKFERNIKKSQQSLDTFKKDLDFKDTAKSVSVLQSAIESITLKPLEDSIVTVKESFNLLYRVVDNVMDRISSKIVDVGKKYAEMFTIEPITAGFQEYETQMGAIQTILANTSSKGSTLDDVNKSLNELNKYADLTIYNFTEMTRNIGTFTAAGIDLETSTRAIQGIANLAAVSGSTSQQASVAMYQLSQALAAGALKLQDWNSVVNAGMGGEVFQNALKETAKTYGIAVDEMIEKAGSFRESLKEGWITSDILTETLSKFTTSGVNEYLAKVTGTSLQTVEAMRRNATASADVNEAYRAMAKTLASSGKISEDQAYQLLNMSTTAEDAATKVKTFTQLIDTLTEAVGSGWTMTWQLILGDFEEAKSFFTDISDSLSDVINKSSDARNAIVSDAMTSNWGKFTSTLEDAGIAVDTFRDKLIEDARKSGLAIDKWIEIDGSFEATLSRGWLTDDRITRTLDSFANNLTESGKEASTAAAKLASYKTVVDAVLKGTYGNGAARVKALTDAGYEYNTIQDLVNRTLAGEKINYDELSDSQLKSLGLTDEQIAAYKELAAEAKKSGTSLNDMINNMSEKSGRQLLIESIKNTLTGVLAIVKSIKQAFKQTFSVGAKPIKNFLKSVNKLTESFANIGYYTNELIRTFSGLFSAVGIVGDILGGAFKFVLEQIGKIINVDAGSVLKLTASVGDNIVAFRKWINENNVVRNTLEKIQAGLINVWNGLGKLKDRLLETEVAKKVFPVLQTGIANVGKFMNQHFGTAITLVKNFIAYLKSLGHIDLSDLPAIFAEFRTMVVDELFKMEGDFTGFGDYLKNNLITSFKNGFSKVRGSLDGFLTEAGYIVDAIKKVFSQLNWGVVFSAVNAALVMRAVDKIATGLTKAASSLKPVTGVINAVKGSLNAFSNTLKQQAFKTQAEAVLELTAAVGILALSLTLLAAIDSDKILKSVGLLTGMVAAVSLIGLLSVGLTKLAGDKKISMAPLSITAVAVSMYIMVGALDKLYEVLSKINDSNNIYAMEDTLHAFVIIMTTFAASAALIGLTAKNMGRASLFIIALALSFKSLISAYDDLTHVSALPMDVAIQITGFIVALGLIARSCKEDSLAISISVLAMAGAIRLLVSTFNEFPNVSSTRKWLKSLYGLVLVVMAFGLVLNTLTKNTSENAAKAGIAALALALSVSALAGGIALIGSIKISTITKGLLVITAFGVVASGLVAVSKLAGESAHKAGIMLLAFSGAVIALTAAVAAFSLMDPEGLKRGIAAVAAIGVVMSALIGLSKLAENASKSIIAIGVVLIAMTTSLAILGSDLLDQNKLIKAAESLAIVMGSLSIAFIGIVAAANKIPNTELGGFLKKMGIMTATFAAISGVMVAVDVLQKITDTQSSIQTVAAISVLMFAMGPAFSNIAKAANSVTVSAGKLTAGLLGMTAVLALVSGVVLGIDAISKKFDLQTSLNTITGISVMLIAVSAALDIMAIGGKMGMAATMTGILSTMALIGGMYALILLIGSLQEKLDGDFTGLQTGLQAVSDLLVGLGNIFADTVVASLSGLPGIGTLLSDFMTNIMGFLDGCDSITIEKIEAVGNLVDMFQTLFDGTYKIKSYEKNKKYMDNLASNLEPFTKIVNDFAEKAKGIDTSGMTKAVNATTAMQQIASLLANDIWAFQAVTDDSNNNINTFSQGLRNYGMALVTLSKVGTIINEEGMGKVVDATSELAEVNGKIPNSGGIWAGIVGDNTWETFGAGLKDYGMALMLFSKVCAIINEEGVEKGKNATEDLAAANEKIPNSGGIWAKLVGDNTWETFGAGLSAYGSALVVFSTKCSYINEDGMKKGKDATDDLATVNEKIPESGGLFGDVFGESTWTSFSNGLSTYATALQSFSIKSKLINATDMQNGIDATEKLIALTEALPTDPNAFFEFFTGTLDWSVLSTGLVDYATSLVNFSDTLSVSSVNYSTVRSAISTMSQFTMLQDTIKKYGLQKANIDWAVVGTNLDGLNSAFTYVGGVSDEQLGKMTNMADMSDKLSTIIQNVSDSVLQDDKSGAIATFKTMLNSITLAAGGFYNTMSGINSTTLDSQIDMIGKIVAMIKNAATVDDGELNKFTSMINTFQGLAAKITNVGPVYSDNKNDARRFKAYIKTQQKQASEVVSTSQKVTRTITRSVEEQQATIDESLAKSNNTGEENGLVSTAKDIWNKGQDFVSGIASSITGGDTQNIISNAAESLSDLFMGNFTVGQSDITAYFKDLGTEYSSSLQTAKSEYDAVLEDYKEGRITASEYDARYTSLLKKYTQDQVGLISYAQDKISDFAKTTLDNVNKDFEAEIKEIQSKIDKLKSATVKSMKDLMTFTTNDDIYQSGLTELETKLEELNDTHDKYVEKYGEDSMQAKQAAKDIDHLEASIETYKKTKADLSGDDTVVDAKFTNKIRNGTTELEEYNDMLEKLRERGLSESLMSLFADMSVSEGKATAKYLLSESDAQLAALDHNYQKYEAAGDKLAQTLYGDKLQDATERYVQTVVDTIGELPDSAKSIGVNIASGLANGFSEETESSLSLIDSSGAKITETLKKLFDIHSPSRVMRDEIGKNLADGLIQGFVERMDEFVHNIGNYIPADLGMLDVNTQTSVNTMNSIISRLNDAIQNGITTSPVITPVLDMSQMQLGMSQLNAMFGTVPLAVPNTLINSTANINANDAMLLSAVNQMNSDICNKLTQIDPVSEISQLRADVNTQLTNMSDRLDNMQVVMDTGALVGQLSGGINQSLGRKATMEGRGR